MMMVLNVMCITAMVREVLYSLVAGIHNRKTFKRGKYIGFNNEGKHRRDGSFISPDVVIGPQNFAIMNFPVALILGAHQIAPFTFLLLFSIFYFLFFLFYLILIVIVQLILI